MIVHTMRVSPEQMARAFMFFMREKPLLKITRKLIIILMIATLSLLMLKLFAIGWSWADALVFSLSFCWLTLGSAFTLWRLKKQMRSTLGHKQMKTTLSPQGIVWQGEDIKSDSASWSQVQKIIETATGFIVMLGARKFIWLPFSGFEIPQQKVRDFLKLQHVKLQLKPRRVI